MNVTPGKVVSFVDRLGRKITGTVKRSYGIGAVVVEQSDGRRRMALTSELEPARPTTAGSQKRSRPAKHK